MTQNIDEERLLIAVAKAVLPDYINSLHRDGVITDEELNNKEIVFSKVRKHLNTTNIELELIVDHRKTLLRYAEEANKTDNRELAIALYATCIEHSLNRIIQTECMIKKIDHKTKTETLRNVSIMGKCTWLISLLGLPKMKEEHIKTVQQISEERNSYFHYKWNPDPDKVPDLERHERMHVLKIKKIKSVLKYLNNYNSRREFRGKKGKIHKHIQK